MRVIAIRRFGQKGFSTIEFLIGAVVFGIISSGVITTFMSIRHSYEVARQLDEIYTVLSACPEIDRALEFNSLNDTANCSPNNTFAREDGIGGTRTYYPSLNVALTTDPVIVNANDPLKNIPDSKILDVKVGFQGSTDKPIELRMLITRNGVGQQ